MSSTPLDRGAPSSSWKSLPQLRLRAVETGSAVLKFSKGPTDNLDVDLPEQRVPSRGWGTTGSGRSSRPSGRIDDPSGPPTSAQKRREAGGRDAAPRATLSDSTHAAVEIEWRRIHVETWSSNRVQTDPRMEAMGRLEEVDFRSHEFRVRDDIGQSVDLKYVTDDVDAAQLVGQWVVATGDGILASGRLVALDHVLIALLDDPARAFERDVVPTLDELPRRLPGQTQMAALT